MSALPPPPPQPLPCYRSGTLHLNRHTALDPSKSEWTDYTVQHCPVLQCGNQLTCNSSGDACPQSSQLAEPPWTDPDLKSGICMSELVSTCKKKRASGEYFVTFPPPPTFTLNPRMRGKSHHLNAQNLRCKKYRTLFFQQSLDQFLWVHLHRYFSLNSPAHEDRPVVAVSVCYCLPDSNTSLPAGHWLQGTVTLHAKTSGRQPLLQGFGLPVKELK